MSFAPFCIFIELYLVRNPDHVYVKHVPQLTPQLLILVFTMVLSKILTDKVGKRVM